MTVTQSQLEALITDRLQQEGWEVSKSLVTDTLKMQAVVARELIAKGEPVPIRDLLKINPRYRPKMPKRTGTFFGEERTVAARPASIVLKATFLKAAKDAVPTGRAIVKIFGTGEPAPAKPKAAPKAAPKPATPKATPRRPGARSKPDATKAAKRAKSK
jgi:hypothetical protein